MTERDLPGSNNPDIDKLIEDIVTHSVIDDAEFDVAQSPEDQLQDQLMQQSISQYLLEHNLITSEILTRGLDPVTVISQSHRGETSPLTDDEYVAYMDYLDIYTAARNVVDTKKFYSSDEAYEVIIDVIRSLVGSIEATEYATPERKRDLLTAVHGVIGSLAPEVPTAEIEQIIEQGALLAALQKLEAQQEIQRKKVRRAAIGAFRAAFEEVYGCHDDSDSIAYKLAYSAEFEKYGEAYNPHAKEAMMLLSQHPELVPLYATISLYYQSKGE